jgi:hypothetical protein
MSFDLGSNWTDAALVKWLADGKPTASDIISLQEEEDHVPTPSADVWASAVGRCPRRHLAEKLQITPVLPEAGEPAPYRKLIFDHATMVEHTWYSILKNYFEDVEPSVKLRNSGLTGAIDMLVYVDRANVIPVEVKCSQSKPKAYMVNQVIAYIKMLEVGLDIPYGVLIIDGGSSAYEAYRVQRNGEWWEVTKMDGSPYVVYRKGPLLINDPAFEVAVAEHHRIWDEFESALPVEPEDLETVRNETFYDELPDLGKYVHPVSGQCVWDNSTRGTGVARANCPWFCHGEAQMEHPVIQGQLIVGGEALDLVGGEWA